MSFLKNLKKSAETTIKTLFRGDSNSGHFDFLNQTAAFVGLPNHKQPRKPQTKENLTANFFGLKNNITSSKLKKSLIPLFVLINFIRLPFTFCINIVRLGTEFLPLFISTFLSLQANSLFFYSKDQQSKHPFQTAAADLLLLLSRPFYGMYLFGRSISSPIQSVQAAWNYGNAFNVGKILGVLFGLFFASLSLMTTLLAYTLLLQWLLPIMVPFIASYLPSFLTTIASIVAPVFNFLLNELLIGTLLSVNATSLWVGLSVLLGLTITVAGPLMDTFLIEPFKTWWNKSVPVPSLPTQQTTYQTLFTTLAVDKPASISTDDLFSSLASTEEDELSEDSSVSEKECTIINQPKFSR